MSYSASTWLNAYWKQILKTKTVYPFSAIRETTIEILAIGLKLNRLPEIWSELQKKKIMIDAGKNKQILKNQCI